LKKLYLVVPCYNETEVICETKRRLVEKMALLIVNKKISLNSKIVFINDGSKDDTWQKIVKFHEESSMIEGINLSCNCGHQKALLAGLLTTTKYADMVISLDADLQDDVNAIDEMVEKYLQGVDIVYGIRSKRRTDTFFKRVTAENFYRIMNFFGVNTVFNHADYRLMSKRALEALASFKEVNLFLRGIIPLIGYSTDYVYYERQERFAGESKYPLKKMIFFALEGITSLSTKPIRYITLLGFFIFFVSIIYFIYIIIQFFSGNTLAGWASMVGSIWLLGGLILMSIGIVGEYVGKIYLESKERPRFIIEEYLKIEDEKQI
jgi:Glycosyltransferases involved in cell wall biogenesis